MARELNPEERKILKMEGDFEERLINNGLARIENSHQTTCLNSTSEFSRHSEIVTSV